MGYNKVILVGRLVNTPELRQSGGGHAVTSFRLAVDRQTQDETDFFDIVAWRDSAEFAVKYFSKGKEILVEAKAQNRSWTDKDGNKRTTTEFVVDRFSFVGSKQTDNSYQNNSYQNQTQENNFAPIEDDDDQLPF